MGLFLISLFITGSNNQGLAIEYITFEYYSFFYIALIAAAFGIVIFLLGLLYDKVFYKCNPNVLLGGACAISLLFGLYWVSSCGVAPQADQGEVVTCASLFNNGNFTPLHKGGYLAIYSHSLGLVTLMRGFFLIFGVGNYSSFQYFNTLMPPLIIFCGAQILRKLSRNDGLAEFYYLFLMLTCFPMYAYTPFVYGDLASTGTALLAAWFLLSCLEKFSLPKVIGLALASGIAVQLRKNTLIILIAFGIVVMISLFRKWKRETLITGLAILVGVVILQAVVNGIYRDVKDPKAEAMPAILWMSMGLHDTNGAPGWYDNYSYVMFTETDYDAETATQLAFEDIKEHLNLFQKDPRYTLNFFMRKMSAQWQSPMYQCIVLNSNIARAQSRLVQMIYREEFLGQFVKWYMKAFQLFMYGSILFWLLSHRKDNMPIETYILLIAVFGGFLFSMIWEAKTRYILPYLLLMIPYFSMGIQELTKWRLRKK